MPSLQSIAELSWRQIFPNPSVESPITLVEFIATARNEFAYQTLLMAWKEKRDEGEYNIPPYLLEQTKLPVINNEMDISGLNVFKSLPQEVWAVNIGGINCICKYVKSTVNLSQLLCGDDSLDDSVRTYYFMNNKIVFPKGTHTSPLTFIYANCGDNVNGLTEVDEAIGSLVRAKLNELYIGKVGKEDVTINQNPEN